MTLTFMSFLYISWFAILQGTNDELLVHVQWDDGTNLSYNLEDKELRIFDNGPAGRDKKIVIYIFKKNKNV